MPNAFPRDRTYSAPTSTHQLSFLYAWNPDLTNSGNSDVTGNYAPVRIDTSGRLLTAIDNLSFSGTINVDDVQVTGGYLAVTGLVSTNSVVSNALLSGISGQLAGTINVTGVTNSGNYGFNNAAITGSQTSVPVGAWSWSVYVESGVGFVNGIAYNTFETIAGGGYDGQKRLTTAINVGCTGTAANPSRLLISWEA